MTDRALEELAARVEAEKIAKGLTEAQKDALTLFESDNSLLWAENEDEITLIRGMTELGLVSTIVITGRYAMQPMPLGLEVRRILENLNDGE